MDELTVSFNSNDRIDALSPVNNAQYYFDFNNVLGEGRYKLRWSLYRLPVAAAVIVGNGVVVPIVDTSLYTGRYFRFVIDSVRQAGSGLQMSELSLYNNTTQISNTGITYSFS